MPRRPIRSAIRPPNANLRAVCLAQGALALSTPIGDTSLNPTAAQANGTFAGSLALQSGNGRQLHARRRLPARASFRGLSLTVDYYHIQIKDAITQPTPGDLINGCFGDNNGTGITAASVTNPICALFRAQPGDRPALDGDPATTRGLIFPTSNSGRILTDGVDFGHQLSAATSASPS